MVRPGDTITDILERTGMSFSEFSALNDDITDLDSGDRVQVIKREVDISNDTGKDLKHLFQDNH